MAIDGCNYGPISRHTLAYLEKRGIESETCDRFPRPVTEADLTAADHIVAVKEAEHRYRFEAKFPAWRDRIEYWQVHDLDCAEPGEAMPHLESEVRELFDRLTAPQRLSAYTVSMPKQSAGLLIYRRRNERSRFSSSTPAAPSGKTKTPAPGRFPKGEFAPPEDPLEAAQRELLEETGFSVDGPFLPLEPIKQQSGKIVHAWAVAADFDADRIQSNTFTMEWPPSSGKHARVP